MNVTTKSASNNGNGTGKGGARKGTAKARYLSNEQIRELSLRLCDDDQERAEALLVLATDMRAREGASGAMAFPFFLVRQTAFSQCGNDAIDAKADLLRSELCGKKGGAA